ncbi:MAG TPA: selenocysteine-specific translation elongation factor [Gemmatimonadales bacterium]|nr:selenocysteine-specific translation elongation factor [Gemmatimonadales bacterium]
MGAVRRFVIGTAGHIDHGKTALVKALTGVDTDRWEEEKRRGITIDLGFAPLALGGGLDASIVDVPGHEGFVRNMLAGATGIDAALLVIAADEGIMPQTEEHLAIVELLGVRRGIPVITKRDLVDDEWLALVESDVAARLASSPVRWDSPVATSSVTGAGLDALREALRHLAADLVERPQADLFRLPIDRVFALPGAGTVVTGSSWSGVASVGDSVRLLPLDRDARIRSIEVHGQAAEQALPGSRTALALVGVDKQELERGHVAVTGDGWRSSRLIDAAIDLLPGAPRPIQVRTRVRVHLGTAEVLARTSQHEPVVPGAQGRVRLVLESPLVARGGDRFVLRSYSPVTTIGGGIVLDPAPARLPRLSDRSLEAGQSTADRLSAWVVESGLFGVSESDLPVRLGILPGDVSRIMAELGKSTLSSSGWLVSRSAVSAEAVRSAEILGAYHDAHPLDPGMSLQALRAAIQGSGRGRGLGPEGRKVPDAIADLVVDLGMRKELLEVAGGVARRAGWKPSLDRGASDSRSAIAQRIIGSRWQLPTVAELEREFPGAAVRGLLAYLVRDGTIEQVDQERYAAPAAIAEFRTALEAALGELGSATPADLRERFELTRKYLIPLLEWADRRGVTERKGDSRVLARLTGRSPGA